MPTPNEPEQPGAFAPLSCLVLHGLGGGPYELRPLTRALVEAGLTVEAPTLPGHETAGPVMPVSHWQDWAATASAAFDRLAASSMPVAVVGFSTGATLALLLASSRPVHRQVLLAPFLAVRYTGWIPIRPTSYLRQLTRIVHDIPRRPPAVRDPEARRWAAQEDRFKTFNLLSALSALALIDHVKPLVPSIRVPTLILQGRLDTVVEPRDAAWLHRHIGSNQKRLHWLDRSDHLLALDRDREEVIEETLAFLLDQPAPASST